MLLVGLTGAIGPGKSTVAHALAARGAGVIDADEAAREVVQPGAPAYAGVAGRFPEALRADGTLDRRLLADIVFADPAALADLNALTHPHIWESMRRKVAASSSTPLTVLEVPLLRPATARAQGLQAVIVVDAPEDLAVQRVAASRGLAPDEVRRRAANQPSRAERLAMADRVIVNGGSVADLEARVDEVWEWLLSLATFGRSGD
ncbi:MAG: dephospho-CoA kinase [Acidimicrobiales bacterium]